jgi:hypothetical protein
MAESIAYFVRGDDGVEYGPVDLAELREWVAENRVGLGTSVRPDAPNSTWSAWQFYPELVALLAEVRTVGNPSALPVLAPVARRIGALVCDLFLSLLLALGTLAIFYAFLPREVIIQQAQFWVQFYEATAQGLNPNGDPPPLPEWYMIAGEIVSFVLPLLYFTCFNAAHGRTPGKSILHLQVVDGQGRKPSFRMALVRGLILMVCVKLWGIPFIYALLNPQRRALHDLVAGTYVVEL